MNNERPITKILSRLTKHKSKGDHQWICCCPAHDDKTESLAIHEAPDGKVLLKCFAGCDTQDIARALGIELKDLFPTRKTGQKEKAREIVATYEYRDDAGAVLYRKVRTEPKGFYQQAPDGRGGWTNSMKGVRQVPYRLPELLAGIRDGRLVWIVEGEKDADRLHSLGEIATTNSGGAGKWPAELNKHFAGAKVVILPDNDKPGREHAELVARALRRVATSVKILTLPGVPDKGDASDYLNAGGTVDELQEMAERLPEWEPPKREEQPQQRTAFSLTDLGNAERFAHIHKGTVRYCSAWKKWLSWSGGKWEVGCDSVVHGRAKSVIKNILSEAAGVDDDEKRKALVDHARRLESAAKIDAMLSLAKREDCLQVKPDDLDRDNDLLNVENGVVDLRTGELLQHDPELLQTKQAAAKYAVKAQCPGWRGWLLEIMGGDQEMVDFLQRAAGYSMTGNTDERCLFILHGNGQNGKSTMLDVLARLLDGYATRTPTDTLMISRQGEGIPNDIARLKGARFVFASEGEEGKKLAEARIKDLTGQDVISARFLHGEFFDFTPRFKIWIGTNHKPEVRGTDNAIWDRIRLIPFNYRVPPEKRIPKSELMRSLLSESSGILNWLIEGCLTWRQEGLKPAEAVQRAGADYRAESDAISSFMSERMEEHPLAKVQVGIAYAQYVRWAKENNEDPLNMRQFGRRLRERGLDIQPGTDNKKFIKGYRIIATQEDQPKWATYN